MYMKYFVLTLRALVIYLILFCRLYWVGGRFIFTGLSIVASAPCGPGERAVVALTCYSTAVSLPLPHPKCMQYSVFSRSWFSYLQFSGLTLDMKWSLASFFLLDRIPVKRNKKVGIFPIYAVWRAGNSSQSLILCSSLLHVLFVSLSCCLWGALEFWQPSWVLPHLPCSKLCLGSRSGIMFSSLVFHN